MDEVSTYEADDYEDEYDEIYDEHGVLIEQIYEEDDQYQDAEEEEMESRPGQFSVYNLFSKQREDTERHVTKRKKIGSITVKPNVNYKKTEFNIYTSALYMVLYGLYMFIYSMGTSQTIYNISTSEPVVHQEVRTVNTLKAEQILNTNSRLRLPRIREQKLDTGAQVTVLNHNTNAKLYHRVSHDRSRPSPVTLTSASGDNMK